MADPLTLVVASGVVEHRDRLALGLRDRFVVHEAADRRSLEHLMVEVKPSVLVIDLALSGLGRAEGLASVLKLSPATRSIALSDCERESEGVDALVQGARGYYSLSIDSPLLGKAVESVRNGDLWIRRTLTQALVTALISRAETHPKYRDRESDRRRLERLTQRQREVAEAIARGASNKEIARRLNVTERTVKAHLTEMFRNVGVLDRLHLALLLNDVPGADFELSAPAPATARPMPSDDFPEPLPGDRAARSGATQSD